MTSWFKPLPELTWLALHFGHDLPVDAVRGFVLNLLTDRQVRHLVLEVESSRTGNVWRIGASNPRVIRRLVATHLPQVTITSATRAWEAPFTTWRLSVRGEGLLLASADLEATTAALLGALAVSGQARTVQQLIIGQRLNPQVVPRQTQDLRGRSWSEQFLTAALVGIEPLEADRRRDLANKRSIAGARVTVRFGVDDPDDDYRQLPAGFIAAWRALATPSTAISLHNDRPHRLTAAHPAAPHQQTSLNADELVAVVGWPLGQRSYPRVDRDRPQRLSITASAAEGRLIGISTDPGRQGRELRLSPKDALRHTVVIGPTGVGKSTLLANMALSDIAANRSVIAIDPKADLVDDLLQRIPDDHLQRTVLLDPASNSHVVGFNPLDVHPNQTHQAVDGIVHVFKTMHSDSWGPRSEDILHASLLTLAASATPQNTAAADNTAIVGGATVRSAVTDDDAKPIPSLIDIPTLLTNPVFRQRVLHRANQNRRLTSPLLAFWDWFENLSNAERSHACAPLLNKLRPFTLRPSLATTLSAANPFSLERIFTERLVLLVPLRKGKIGSVAAELFASVVVSELWRTIQTRAAIDPKLRHPSFVYADEFQEYLRLPTDLADVLAHSRGLGVGWSFAHQNLDQLPTVLQRTVAANAQNKIYFRLGHQDASRIAKAAEPLRPTDLTRLPAFEAYASILNHGQQAPFASIRTQPLPLRHARPTADQLLVRWGQPVGDPHSPDPRAQGTDLVGGSDTVALDAPIGRRSTSSTATETEAEDGQENRNRGAGEDGNAACGGNGASNEDEERTHA